jgi:PIN domain nuclease of toxin-antitoxin system
MSDVVLDSSAILAFVRGEPGGDIVADYRGRAAISAVNLAEVRTRLSDYGFAEPEIDGIAGFLDARVEIFGEREARAAGMLRRTTRHLGLSLGDRACLALAQQLGLPVLTADRNWAKLKIGVEVHLIR